MTSRCWTCVPLHFPSLCTTGVGPTRSIADLPYLANTSKNTYCLNSTCCFEKLSVSPFSWTDTAGVPKTSSSATPQTSLLPKPSLPCSWMWGPNREADRWLCTLAPQLFPEEVRFLELTQKVPLAKFLFTRDFPRGSADHIAGS